MGKLVKILPLLIAVAVVSLCALPVLAAAIDIGADVKDGDISVGEILAKRTETGKTYYLGNSRYALDVSMGAIHYKDDYSNPNEQWKDIDLTWEGNRIIKAPYELTLVGNKITVRDKKTGEVSTIELLEIGGIPVPPQAWDRSKGLAKAFATDLEIVAGNGSVSFTRILKSDKAAVEAKYKVTGNIPLRIKASDTEGELPVEWTIKDGILTEALKPDRPIKYPVRIDPTLDPQVGASADDADENESSGVIDLTGVDIWISSAPESYNRQWGGFRFVSDSFPAQGTDIDVAYLKGYIPSALYDDANFYIHFEELAAPAAFTTDAFNITGRDRTEASVAWIANSIGTGWKNSPSLCGVGSPIQEVFDAYSPTTMVVIIRPNTDAYKYFDIHSWEYNNNTWGAILHLEWTGVVAPTVTTQAASVIEATTATGNGTITATGGENATIHGIEWDIDTGAPYANDVHTHGDFGLGAFTDALTGLPTGTTIYCRAYATNTAGTGYGAEVSFLTKPAAPTDVAATENQSAKVVVTWTKSTGATGYKVYEGVNLLDTLGDVATYDHTTGDAPTITGGSVVATDGTETAHIALSLAGTSVANGTTYTYKVVALNATGDSTDSNTDTGYRLASAITYQWNKSAADSDAGYTPIDGATASTYEDVATPAGSIDNAGAVTASDGTSSAHVVLSLAGESTADGAGRYFTCTLVSTDADNTPQTATANRGYRGVGAITYQWQRSSGDSDADYSNIDGATTDPYNDTDGVVTPDGRYYQCIVSSVDASNTPQTSDNNRGYRSAALLPPTAFLATYVSDTQVTLTWVTGIGATNTYIRGKQGSYPVDRTDGYEVYNGALETIDDITMNFDVLGENVYYRGWGEKAAVYSDDYAEDNVGGIGMTLLALSLLALGLTIAMFHTRNMMLGFPCVMMWAILGGFAYTESTTAWGDWQYYLFFASAFGMTIFCALAMFALRSKKEEKAEGDEYIDEGKDDIRYIDEGSPSEGDKSEESEESKQTKRVRSRAKERREKASRRMR